MKFIDLSHEIEAGMITYRGLPGPIISDFLSREASRQNYAEGVEFQIGKIEMVANTGTYLDTPYHRYESGADLSSIDLSAISQLDGIKLDATPVDRAIDRRLFQTVDVKNKAVLVRSGWDAHWRTEQYFEGHPFLTRDAAEFLVSEGAALVGIDSYNIDDTRDPTRPVHSILLKAGIPIVEHLRNLQSLPRDFLFFAVPPKIKGLGSFPVRAFAAVLTANAE
jgi:arylformamidase